MNKTRFCAGISDISDSYSGFIIDELGVIHDGVKLFDGVAECLMHLKERKKHVIILSNSGRRAKKNAERLRGFGITEEHYNDIITSGEITWQGLNDQNDGYFKEIGKKCVIISRGEDDCSIVDGLDVEVVDDPKQASFLLIAGTDAPHKTIEDYEPILKQCARYNLKAICANPDDIGVMGSVNVFGPGTLAARYKDFGGIVEYIGKPHSMIFQYCIRLLQEQGVYPGQTVVIGDAMAHDILGGSMVNIDTCLVKRGLHYSVFKTCENPAEVDRMLNILARQYNNVHPNYLVEILEWGKALPDRKHKKRGPKSSKA
ncbi:MAG: TIGR01459 family HAD-type hydrolase [Alphaproteobacteria bacterium]|nr:TIGR01459 family HAD-type hydrolase [Alphaproteobacteria bacterium]